MPNDTFLPIIIQEASPTQNNPVTVGLGWLWYKPSTDTWYECTTASPIAWTQVVDSAITSAIATHAGLPDPHTGYRLESADHTHASTGAQAGQLDHGNAMVAASLLDDDHTQYQLESSLMSTIAGKVVCYEDEVVCNDNEIVYTQEK